MIVVAGHADSRGSPDVNYEEARRRAEAVSRYLITRKQADPLHVQTISYGESSPREDNKTRQGRAANRRNGKRCQKSEPGLHTTSLSFDLKRKASPRAGACLRLLLVDPNRRGD